MPLRRMIPLACAVAALAAPAAARARDEVATGREAPGFTAPSTTRAAAGCAAGQQTRTTERFVISYDTAGTHAVPGPEFVDAVAAELKASYDVEVTQLGWRAPQGRTPVCLSDVGAQGNYGYASPGQLTLDNDYKASQYPASSDLVAARRATIAHEFNHVLQFLYGGSASEWQAESVSTWAEEQVFDQANDYVHFVDAWAACPGLPLTFASGTSLARTDPCRRKVYGAASFNHWLSETYGTGVIRRTYEKLSGASSFGPRAYGDAIGGGIPAFQTAFTGFAVASAEWRAPGAPFPDRYADMTRMGVTLAPGAADLAPTLKHTAYALYSVAPIGGPRLRLHARLPAGVSGAIALVGRTGNDPNAGTTSVDVAELPDGGAGNVTLSDPGAFGRITAVVVNTDVDRSAAGSWLGDDQPFCNLRVSTAIADASPEPACSPPANSAGSDSAATSVTSGANIQVASSANSTTGPPASASVVPTLVYRVTNSSQQRRRSALGRGVAFSLRCNRACSGLATVTLSRAAARRLKLSRTLGTATTKLSKAGDKTVRVKLNRKARAKLRRTRKLAITLTVRTKASTGAAKTTTRKITIVR